jgi:hypothetical protein
MKEESNHALLQLLISERFIHRVKLKYWLEIISDARLEGLDLIEITCNTSFLVTFKGMCACFTYNEELIIHCELNIYQN